jgi:chromosome partitioning protein
MSGIKIVTVANQKGGCGKTTLTMGLAGTLGVRGHRVLVIDADSQATATRWAAAADDDAPFPATVIGLAATPDKLHREIRKHIHGGYDFIIVDCPPSLESPAPQSAMLVSDLVIVPVIPSPADLWATQGMKRLIEHASALNESLHAIMVANMVPHTALGRDALCALKEFGLPLANGALRQRTAYRESAVEGVPVQGLGPRAREATAEINALTDEIHALLRQGKTQHD